MKGQESMNDVEKEILRLEEELTETEMRVDVAALDRIYADDIMVTAPIGICVDKPAVMTEIRQASDKATVERYDKDNLKVRAFGDTAVTSYRITATARFEDKEINAHLCITNVWLKRRERWQSRQTYGQSRTATGRGSRSLRMIFGFVQIDFAHSASLSGAMISYGPTERRTIPRLRYCCSPMRYQQGIVNRFALWKRHAGSVRCGYCRKPLISTTSLVVAPRANRFGLPSRERSNQKI